MKANALPHECFLYFRSERRVNRRCQRRNQFRIIITGKRREKLIQINPMIKSHLPPFSHGRSDFTRNGRQNYVFIIIFFLHTVSNPLDFFNFSPKSLTIQPFLHRFEPQKIHLGLFVGPLWTKAIDFWFARAIPWPTTRPNAHISKSHLAPTSVFPRTRQIWPQFWPKS